MRERLLGAISALGVERPYAVLGAALALTLVAAALVPSLEISTSRFDVIAGETSFVEAPGARTDLVALVTADDDATTRATADALAARLAEAPGVRGVFHRVDPAMFRGRELLFLSEDEARAMVAGAELRGLGDWVGAARAGLGGDRAETLDALDDDGAIDDEAGLAWLTAMLEEAEAWQRDPERTTLGLGLDRRDRAPVDAEGYLTSGDGRTRYVLVTPEVVTDRYDAVAPLVRQARAIAAEVASEHDARIRFTGYPALAVDEVEAIRGGSLVTGVVSGVLVMLLFALGFRSRGGVVVAGLPLGLGMLWAFGGIAVALGHLNLLTQAAAPVFVGLGIDFAVHLLSAYDAARRGGAAHAAAIDAAMRGAGKAILTGGLTTAGAFGALLVTEHDAFRELGLVAGLGLLVVLGAVLFLTPALLTVGQRRGWLWLMVGQGPAPAWTRPAEGRLVALTGRPWVVLGGVAAITAALALGVGRVRFEANVEALLPADAPSVIAARQLRADETFSSEVLVTRAPDLATLARRTAALEALPSVGHVESLASFAPPDSQRILQIARATPVTPSPPTAPLGERLRGL
ncbi:MAG: MMPL family transporter, partial [Myxococcales bacterium]|nr:MMPL family transporter [Myxococcales bacterium]